MPRSVSPKSNALFNDPRQDLFARFHKLQERVAANRLRSLQIATDLAHARKLAARTDNPPPQTLVQHLEKALRLAQEGQRHDQGQMDRLWKELQ